jgi:micrococcal nuclease
MNSFLKNNFILLLFLTFPIFSETLTVKKISDGDTVLLGGFFSKKKIRLWGIDAPEKNQAYGKNSTNALKKLIPLGSKVQIQCKGKDRYKRELCEIFRDDLNINKEMIRTGNAWVYTKYNNDVEYRNLEEKAREGRVGLWSSSDPTPPWEFRKKGKSR